MALRDLGYEAISLSGPQAGILTDTSHGRARISRVDTERMERELGQERILVVAGFQGATEGEDITTLGRGGSDTTAVALAVALKARRCEIFHGCRGHLHRRPPRRAGSRKLDRIGYEEMLELSYLGAKMHPRSIELGAVYRMPIYVASSFTDTPGTLIDGDWPSALDLSGPVSQSGAGAYPSPPSQPSLDSSDSSMEDRLKVTGIAYSANVAKITIRGVPDRPGIAAALFEPLAAAGISVDTIVQNTSEERTTDISFTVTRTDLPAAVGMVEQLAPEVGAAGVTSDDGLASVSIVGSGMQNTPGYASRMFRALADSSVNIDMITTSEIRISCIIREDQCREAVRLLHHAFGLDRV